MVVTSRPPVILTKEKTKQNNNINRVLNRTNKIVDKLNELREYLKSLHIELDKKNVKASNKLLLKQMYNGLSTFIDTFYAILFIINKKIEPTNKPNNKIKEIANKEKEVVTKQSNNKKKYKLLYQPIKNFNDLYKEILPKINSKIVLRLLPKIKEIIKDIMVLVTRLESGK
jgi:hypothetical protein